MRRVVVVVASLAVLMAVPSTADAPHAGCVAANPGRTPCTYTAAGSHNAIIAVNGAWSFTGTGGVNVSGSGPVPLQAIPAAAGEQVTVTVAGNGVISTGNTSAHP